MIIKTPFNIGNINSFTFNNINDEISKKYSTNIGLINASDYLYLEDNNWLKNKKTFLINQDREGNILVLDNEIKTTLNILYPYIPCVYLRSDVSITGGVGTKNNPYILDILYPLRSDVN